MTPRQAAGSLTHSNLAQKRNGLESLVGEPGNETPTPEIPLKNGDKIQGATSLEKIRFIAYFNTDVSAVFPYLNAVLKGAIYNHFGKTLTLRKEVRLITLHPDRIAAGKVADERDAGEIILWIKDLINQCWANLETIQQLFQGQNTEKRTELLRLLKASGYEVPSGFVTKGR